MTRGQHCAADRPPIPFVRRSEVGGLILQVAEAEQALASLYEKYNTMAARFRKREQRAAERAAHEPAQLELVPQGSDRKAHLRHRAAMLRGLGTQNGAAVAAPAPEAEE